MSQWQKAIPHATFTEMEETVKVELGNSRIGLVKMMVWEEAASQDVQDYPRLIRK